MHRLILMRHAKAERDAPSGRDRDRPLAERGRADAVLMGRALAQRGWKPDHALVSAATRTRETFDLARDAFGDVETAIDEALYNADADTLRRMVEAMEDTAGCLLVVAHNPGIHQLAFDYLTESASSPVILDRMAGGFPTGAVALFGVDPAGRCVHEGFLTPKALGGGDA